VHTTASGEETASQDADQARGMAVTWRDRYEIPWQIVTTAAELHQRLEESRYMRHAIQRYVAGLAHDDAHLGQIAEILRHSRQSRIELAMI